MTCCNEAHLITLQSVYGFCSAGKSGLGCHIRSVSAKHSKKYVVNKTTDSPEEVVVVPPAEVGLLLLRGKGCRKRWRSSSGSGGGGGGGGRGRARDSGTAGGGGGEGAEAEGGVRSGKAKICI